MAESAGAQLQELLAQHTGRVLHTVQQLEHAPGGRHLLGGLLDGEDQNWWAFRSNVISSQTAPVRH